MSPSSTHIREAAEAGESALLPDAPNGADHDRRHETARAHLVTRVPTARADETVGDVVARLPRKAYDSANAVYVADAAGRLRGFVTLPALLTQDHRRPLRDIMVQKLPRVRPDDDQEHVAHAALRYGVVAVPVVDADDRLIGVVPPRALMQILYREHVEDLHRLAGIQRERAWSRSASDLSPQRQLWHRLPWLLVGLVGGAAATWVMSRFEQVLAGHLAAVFFAPALVYLTDAVGTQTEAVTIRELATRRSPFRRVVRHEALTGLLIGIVLAGIAFPGVVLVYGSTDLGLAVAVALATAATLAATLGLVIPWALDRLGLDPAFGAGPAATIVQDILSLVIYFTMVRLFLG